MKAIFFFAVLLSGSIAFGQVVTPSNPNSFTKRNLSENGGASTGTVSGTVRQVQTVQYTAVTPVKGWTNLEGKTIQARLLAFSAPEPGKTGPIEVIREGMVRLLIPGGKGPVNYPLEKLEEADRTEIERIAKAAAQGPPATEEKAAEEGQEQK